MAIQSEIFSTSYGVRSFSSTKHIATKQHMAIWLKRISDNIWVQLSTTKYELINNSAVLAESPSSSIYSEIEVRVADEPDELSQSQSDIGVVASNITNINLVAENIDLITQQANGEYIVSSLPSSAQIGDVAVNVADGNIYKYEESGWVYIGESGTSNDSIITTPTLPSTGVAEGTVMLNTTDNQFYKYTNGAWVVVALTTGVAQEVADASITTAKFASGIIPVELFDALPSSGNFNGRIGFLKTDFKLYRHNGTAWISTVSTIDLIGTISSVNIGANTITAPKILAGSIEADKIAANAVTAGKIDVNAVTAGTIAAGAVNADQIAAGAIRSDKIYSNAIQTYHMAAGSINADRIAVGTLTADKIVSNSLTRITAGTIQVFNENTTVYLTIPANPNIIGSPVGAVAPRWKYNYIIEFYFDASSSPSDITNNSLMDFYAYFGDVCAQTVTARHSFPNAGNYCITKMFTLENNTDSYIYVTPELRLEKEGTWVNPGAPLYFAMIPTGIFYSK